MHAENPDSIPVGSDRSQPERHPSAPDSAPWTAARLFELLAKLGRLRVVSICGPSVFESLCEAGPFTIERGSLNMITTDFHWHVALARFRHLQSHESIHARSGRNVLFFELREDVAAPPFLRIYVHRAPKAEFDPAVAEIFAAAHAELANGVALASGVDAGDAEADGKGA
ncbi:MAG: hypothetical protein R3F35_07810 [Myxococcota bacterium]